MYCYSGDPIADLYMEHIHQVVPDEVSAGILDELLNTLSNFNTINKQQDNNYIKNHIIYHDNEKNVIRGAFDVNKEQIQDADAMLKNIVATDGVCFSCKQCDDGHQFEFTIPLNTLKKVQRHADPIF